MISEAGKSLALYSDNVNVFPDIIALFQLTAGSGGSGTPPPSTTLTTSTKTTTSTTAPAATGWNFRGCYTDNVSGRALVNNEVVPGGASGMSIEACQTECHSLGYTLAGVEYGDECYCDNKLENGGVIASDGSAQCNMKCANNAAETCGGPNRLDLYSWGYGNGTAIPTS